MTVSPLQAVPHLTTANQGPLLELESRILAHQGEIEAWLREAFRASPAPFYASVDLRNAGFKLAPVDTNLFPAGFNNLNSAFLPLCILALQSATERFCPTAKGILIIPESHTRNLYYLESLATLEEIVRMSGYEVRVGSLLSDLQAPRDFDLPSGRQIRLHPLHREGDRVYVQEFSPCAVLLNNDLAGGRPAILEGLEQEVIPPLDFGWVKRLKSQHFNEYSCVAAEFADLLDIDPWFVDPLFRNCGEIDFMTRDGEECLAINVGKLLDSIQEKYDEHGITKQPFVVIKADAGTYGMGIMSVTNSDEIHTLNRKQRSRMSATKEGLKVTRVILQEGVHSFETWGPDQAVAEPVIYMIDHFVVGGFYRVHTKRGPTENLNSPGMHFQPLAFAEACNIPDGSRAPDAEPNRFYAFGVIARLALLAAAREIEAGA
jgi:glutamate--cysteine ligase